MKTYTKTELNKVLRNHKHWLLQDCDGWAEMRADLSGANLSGAKNIPSIPMACPDTGEFTAWKKASCKIVKLLIPAEARRGSATGRKCRCDKAIVLAIQRAFRAAEIKILSTKSVKLYPFRISARIDLRNALPESTFSSIGRRRWNMISKSSPELLEE